MHKLIIGRDLKVTQSVLFNYFCFFFLLSEIAYFDVIFEFGKTFVWEQLTVVPITVITFICNESATWEASTDGKVPQVAHAHVNYSIVGDILKVGNIA